MGLVLVCLAWGLAAGVLLAARGLARRWRQGRPVRVDWVAGLAAVPRRYLVDVHHVVERRPEAARMHVPTAGGLLAGSVALMLAVLPALRGSRVYWAVVAVLFAAALWGAILVRRRRRPVVPSFLSAGMFLWLPAALGAYAGGALLLALGMLAVPGGGASPLLLAPLLLAVGGAGGLLVQFARGPMRHAFAGTVWLAAHARPGRFGGGRDTALRPLDLDAPRLGALAPSDFAWTALASFDACIQCGRCEQACPAFAAGQRLNPKALIQDLVAATRGGSAAEPYSGSPAPNAPPVACRGSMDAPVIGVDAMIHPDTLWACTTCRACVEECPMMIEHVDAIVDLRRGQALMLGQVRPGAAQALRRMRDSAEPGGRPLAARADGLAALDVPVLPEGGETDILLWLGEGAFDLRYGRTLQALVRLMRLAGLRFAILGEAETDCGDLARRLGDEATFHLLAGEAIATLKARTFQRIVTADPHALHVLRNEYPALGGHWTVQHHTALLDELVTGGALRLAPRDLPPVAYHDPCYLGRYNGEIAAPRRLLDAACGTRVEMERHGMRSMCCGGGGGNPISDVDGAARIPDLRMAQADAAGAAIVAVGCPGCTAMLEGVPAPRPEVRDIAELVLDAVVTA